MSELLLIDDDQELCELLGSWLTQEGFSVRACHDGQSARLALAEHAPAAVVLAGPHPAIDSNDPGVAGFSGSLIVAEFDSLAAAQAWADADPYIAAGVYDKVIVKPFKQVLP